MSIDLCNLKDLPTADKLRIVTELWNDIAESNETIVVPEEIVREASQRAAVFFARMDTRQRNGRELRVYSATRGSGG